MGDITGLMRIVQKRPLDKISFVCSFCYIRPGYTQLLRWLWKPNYVAFAYNSDHFGSLIILNKSVYCLFKSLHQLIADDLNKPELGLVNHNDELYLLYSYLEDVLPIVRRNRRKDIGSEQLKVLEFMVIYLTEMVEQRHNLWEKLNGKAKKKLTAKIDTITKALRQRDQKISEEEMKLFHFEQNRIIRFGDLLMLESSGEFEALKSKLEIQQYFKAAETLINHFSEYSDDQDKKVLEAIKKLKEAIKSNAEISPEDRRMIHKAMSTSFYGGAQSQGHWFKCPNGHTYAITECGGAMEEAVCPEKGCGVRIGGRNHRYLPNQQLASEMDGAQRPAWSSGYDMRNFNLNNLH